MSALPYGWCKVSIRDVTKPFANTDPRKTPEKTFKYVDIGSIDNNSQTIAAPKIFKGADAPSRARRVIHAGDTLFSTVRTYLKNIALVPKEFDGELTSTGISVLRPNEGVDPRYLFVCVSSDNFVDEVSVAQDGTMYPAVSDQDVADALIRVPPLPEQHRIVAKIDSLRAKSKRARDRLDHISRLVEKYKQAILAAAFRGQLTRKRDCSRWQPPSPEQLEAERRETFVRSGVRVPTSKTSRAHEMLPPYELPDSWCWVRAEAVNGFITKGTTPAASKMSSQTGEVPYIKVYNLTFDGSLDFSIEPTFVSKKTHHGQLRRSIVKPGDVLMNIVGPPLGKVSIVGNEWAEWNINQAIAVFRPIRSLDGKFLARWLLSGTLLSWAMAKAKATAGQSNLTLEICRDLPVPLCSLSEQHEINRHIDTAFAWINRLASEATNARKLIDHLDQAILAKAFRGELVPQDPADEPATVLLERIRAERTPTPNNTLRGRRRPSQGNNASPRPLPSSEE
jgi:type I restriction enzyme, S subunit